MKLLDKEKLTCTLSERIGADAQDGRIGAAAVSVMQNGEDVFTGFFDTTEFKGSKVPDGRSLFRMASMTKPITTVAFGALCDNFGVSLDDTVDKYIPRAKELRMKVFTEEKTVADLCSVSGNFPLRRLLNHTSGIGSEIIGAYNTDHLPQHATASLKDAVEFWLDAGVAFYPGSRQCYSPTAAFDVAGRIIEMVSGMDVSSFFKKYVFDKCNMPDTTFIPSDEQWKRIVWMHDKREGKAIEKQMSPGCVFGNIPVTYPLCGGGLISCLDDYKNFAQMLLNGGTFGGETVISPEYFGRMSKPTLPEYIMMGDQRWGLGVRVITGEGYRKLPVGTFGWSGAYGTHFWVDPVNKITAIYLKNSVFGTDTAGEFEQMVSESFKEN